MPAGAAGFSFSGISVINASVVRIIEAMMAAFCTAERVTWGDPRDQSQSDCEGRLYSFIVQHMSVL